VGGMTLRDLMESNEVFNEFATMINAANNVEELSQILLQIGKSADLEIDEINALQELMDAREEALSKGTVEQVINKNNISVNKVVIAKMPILASQDNTFLDEGEGAVVIEVLEDGIRVMTNHHERGERVMKFTWEQANKYLISKDMLMKQKPGEEFELSVEDKNILKSSIDSSKLTDSDFENIQKNVQDKKQEDLENELYENNPCES
jgi:hypothetical protein